MTGVIVNDGNVGSCHGELLLLLPEIVYDDYVARMV